jgi:hypothetical protein
MGNLLNALKRCIAWLYPQVPADADAWYQVGP